MRKIGSSWLAALLIFLVGGAVVYWWRAPLAQRLEWHTQTGPLLDRMVEDSQWFRQGAEVTSSIIGTLIRQQDVLHEEQVAKLAKLLSDEPHELEVRALSLRKAEDQARLETILNLLEKRAQKVDAETEQFYQELLSKKPPSEMNRTVENVRHQTRSLYTLLRGSIESIRYAVKNMPFGDDKRN